MTSPSYLFLGQFFDYAFYSRFREDPEHISRLHFGAMTVAFWNGTICLLKGDQEGTFKFGPRLDVPSWSAGYNPSVE